MTTLATNWQDELDGLSAQVTKQGSAVRQLKKDGAEADMIAEAIQKLQELKIQSSTLQALHATANDFDRKAFDDLVLRKMFVIPSFEIHGGVKGLFDLGPPACALKVSSIRHSALTGLDWTGLMYYVETCLQQHPRLCISCYITILTGRHD